jgi:quinol monooxygenase YgiN
VRPDISDDQWLSLVDNLQSLASTVKAAEPQTLAYRVHTAAADPRKDSSLGQQEARRHITFYEIYQSEEAFQKHLNGKPFTGFLRENLQYFVENPERKNYPLTHTTFLQEQSGFFSESADS